MSTACIIQARMLSTRLPGKVLMDICGTPMLQRVVSRASRSCIDTIVATSDDPSDDPIAEFCDSQNIACFRGSQNDLIARYYYAALDVHADIVVRVTGDCPLIDPRVVQSVVELYESGDYDYVSNVQPPTFPDGLDTEVFSFAALERAFKEAALPSEREHISPFFENRPTEFRLGNVAHDCNLSSFRWTVDQPEDLCFVQSVYEFFGDREFHMPDVLELLEAQPELRAINSGINRNEGHASAYEADKAFLASE